MADFVFTRALEKLRDAGYKLTHARRMILRVLCDDSTHLTSADIIRKVEAADSSIGRASIFRTLDLLTSLGIVRPTFLEPRTPSYVLMPSDGHHAHVVCTRCSAVVELTDCALEGLLVDIGLQHGLTLTGHLLELYGICQNCTQAGLTR